MATPMANLHQRLPTPARAAGAAPPGTLTAGGPEPHPPQEPPAAGWERVPQVDMEPQPRKSALRVTRD